MPHTALCVLTDAAPSRTSCMRSTPTQHLPLLDGGLPRNGTGRRNDTTFASRNGRAAPTPPCIQADDIVSVIILNHGGPCYIGLCILLHLWQRQIMRLVETVLFVFRAHIISQSNEVCVVATRAAADNLTHTHYRDHLSQVSMAPSR